MTDTRIYSIQRMNERMNETQGEELDEHSFPFPSYTITNEIPFFDSRLFLICS